MLVWTSVRRTYARGAGADAAPRRVPRVPRPRRAPRACRAGRAGSAGRARSRVAALELPRVRRDDDRRLPRPGGAVQRQPSLPPDRGRARCSTRSAPRPSCTTARLGPLLAGDRRRRPGAHRRRRRFGCRPLARQHRARSRDRDARRSRRRSRTPSPDDLYLVCTGGTTGRPKGVLWRQADIYVARDGRRRGRDARDASRPSPRGRRRRLVRRAAADARGRAVDGRSPRCTTAARSCCTTTPRRSTRARSSRPRHRERVQLLTIVGDAYARPIVDELRARSVRPVVACSSWRPAAR